MIWMFAVRGKSGLPGTHGGFSMEKVSIEKVSIKKPLHRISVGAEAF